MEQKKGIFQGWGVLEIGLVAVILVLCLAAGGLGVAALAGFELFGSNQAGEVAETDGTQPADSSDGIQAAATPTVAPTVPGQEDAAGSSTDTDATIELSNGTASPGSTVTVIGNGWPANSRVVISLVPSEPPAYAVNSVIVQTDGTFSVDFIVPSDGRWLQESPVPVVAQAVDMNITAQASLTIVSVTDGSPAVTPVAVGIIVVGKVVVTPQPPPPAGVAQLTATANVNVRTGPGTNYDIVGVLLAGQTAEITGRNADATWWQIKFPGTPGGLGWVSAAYSSAQNIGNVPVVAAPPPPPPPPPTPPPNPALKLKAGWANILTTKIWPGRPRWLEMTLLLVLIGVLVRPRQKFLSITSLFAGHAIFTSRRAPIASTPAPTTAHACLLMARCSLTSGTSNHPLPTRQMYIWPKATIAFKWTTLKKRWGLWPFSRGSGPITAPTGEQNITPTRIYRAIRHWFATSRRLATTGGLAHRLRELSRKITGLPAGHAPFIWKMAITPCNSALKTACASGLMKIWSLIAGQMAIPASLPTTKTFLPVTTPLDWNFITT